MSNIKRRNFLIGIVALPAAAAAHSYEVGPVQIGHAWALPSEGTETSAMMPILNTGEDDALVAVRSPAADKVELREGDGTTPKRFNLAKNRPFPMRPNGPHLQLIGLRHTFRKDEYLPLTLVFEKAGKIDIEARVELTPGT